MVKKYFSSFLVASILFIVSISPSFASHHTYMTGSYAGLNAKYIIINMNATGIKAKSLTANDNLVSTKSVAQMAKDNGAFAAINGTYFDPYGHNKHPVPYGTIIKDGKLIHASNGAPVAGFKEDGSMIIDRLSFDFYGYVNGEHKSIPWRINHPAVEPDSITIYTPHYGTAIDVVPGARAALVSNGTVVEIASSNFTVPSDGFAILYGPSVAYLCTERFHLGDKASWDYEIKTSFTSPSDWDDVVNAIGAGPSLVINGQITADATTEGFTEAKITAQANPRSFVGATSEGKVFIGNFASATIKQAAKACKEMGLVNAMCLDGGGSVGLYYNGKSISAGRNVNNALGFLSGAESNVTTPPQNTNTTITPTSSKVYVDGKKVDFQAYTINSNNYFKLRDLAYALKDSDKKFKVGYDNSDKAISLESGKNYTPSGNELAKGKGGSKATKSESSVYLDGNKIELEAYVVEGNTYFKLRDLMEKIDIYVGFDKDNNSITLDSSKSYE